jgi:hypothetical protein
MSEPTYDDALEWLSQRAGREVYIEIGMADPQLPEAQFFPVKFHTTLGSVEIGEDMGHAGRGVASYRLGQDPMNRLRLDQARVTRVQVHGSAMRVWFHISLYVGVSVSA